VHSLLCVCTTSQLAHLEMSSHTAQARKSSLRRYVSFFGSVLPCERLSSCSAMMD